LEKQLSQEIAQKTEERIIAAKHIAEKTKLCDGLQKKIESNLGDMDAIKKKHSQTVKVSCFFLKFHIKLIFFVISDRNWIVKFTI
jgi:hypothetical protein